MKSVVAHLIVLTCLFNCEKREKPKPHLCTMMGSIFPADSLLGESTLRWSKKQVTVYFLDDDYNLRDKVMSLSNKWSSFSGITFVKTTNKTASDIRVSFRTKGWWSHIGTDALQINKKSTTLSLGGLHIFPPDKIQSVVLHEFGHALGLLHEHQHPGLKIKWNRPALFAYYDSTYGMDSMWVKEHVIDLHDSPTGMYCEPDLHSIMMYEIPPGLTEDNIVIEEPKDLSPLDKKYIKYFYDGTPCP